MDDLTKEEIQRDVVLIVAKQIEVDPASINLDSTFPTRSIGEAIEENPRLQTDLNVDSLDFVEIAMDIETKFGIDIPDTAAERFDSIGAIVDYVKAKLEILPTGDAEQDEETVLETNRAAFILRCLGVGNFVALPGLLLHFKPDVAAEVLVKLCEIHEPMSANQRIVRKIGEIDQVGAAEILSFVPENVRTELLVG